MSIVSNVRVARADVPSFSFGRAVSLLAGTVVAFVVGARRALRSLPPDLLGGLGDATALLADAIARDSQSTRPFRPSACACASCSSSASCR